MRSRTLITLMLTVGCAPAARPVAPAASSVLDWHPNLDQAIGELEENLAAADQQQPMNYASSNLAFALDAQLYFCFESVLERLPTAGRAAAIDAQRAWLLQRKRATDEAYAEYEGGTLAALVANRAFIDATRARIASLASPTTEPTNR